MIVVWVREVESKNFLGLFWASDHDELWWLVDQYDDPAGYEFCKANKRGGALKVIGDVSTDKYRCEAIGEDTADEDYLLTFDMDEGAQNDLYKPKWKRFDFADVGHGGIAQVLRERNAT